MLAPAASPLLAVAVCSSVFSTLTTHVHAHSRPPAPFIRELGLVGSKYVVCVQMSLRNFYNTLTNFALSGTTQELLLKLNYSYLIIFINGRHKCLPYADTYVCKCNKKSKLNLEDNDAVQGHTYTGGLERVINSYALHDVTMTT